MSTNHHIYCMVLVMFLLWYLIIFCIIRFQHYELGKAKSNGLSKAEFLAIDDEEFQHKRLVRYYQIMGFKVFRYVGEDVRNIPDRLIWGGCGTLMGEDVMVLLAKWTKKLFGSK
mmetsp:Transcript_51901/g.155771  ORF Transcript_51901/g.155771 Transcript_51901/m.155771 type:complete len:114 (+) Transcript_51901:1033-1374(+)